MAGIQAQLRHAPQLRMAAVYVLLISSVATVSAARVKGRITVIRYQEGLGDEAVVFGPVPIKGKSGPNYGKGVVYDAEAVIDGETVGHAHGLYVRDNLKVDDYITITATLAFDKGAYKRSTITLAGDFVFGTKVNKLAVTGGTGVFEFARGSAKYVTRPDHYDVTLTLKSVIGKH